jgi:hypothetical protein
VREQKVEPSDSITRCECRHFTLGRVKTFEKYWVVLDIVAEVLYKIERLIGFRLTSRYTSIKVLGWCWTTAVAPLSQEPVVHRVPKRFFVLSHGCRVQSLKLG